MKEEIEKFDDRGNCIYKVLLGHKYWMKYNEYNSLIYYKNSSGYEEWREYDEEDNWIYTKNSNSDEEWYEYDEDNELIHYRDSYGHETDYETENEYWNRYENGERISITRQEFAEIKFRKQKKEQEKEFLSRKPVSRFEIMDL